MLVTQQLIDKQLNKGKKITLAIFIVLLITVPLVSYYLYSNFTNSYLVIGNEMEPNYIDGERYTVKKDLVSIRRGEVVVFKPVGSPSELKIQRIIGLPGEKISFKDGNVFLNNARVEESYLPDDTETLAEIENTAILNEEIQTIPEGYYFLLNDNRADKKDSRTDGFVLKQQITGVVDFCYSECK